MSRVTFDSPSTLRATFAFDAPSRPSGTADAISAVVLLSPASLDKGNLPAFIRANVVNRRNTFPQATQMRMSLFGTAAMAIGTATVPYRPGVVQHAIALQLVTSTVDAIRALPERQGAVIEIEFLDDGNLVVGEAPPRSIEVIEGATAGGADQAARAAAAAAATQAEKNRLAIAAEEARRFAARLAVWPPNVGMHTDVQRNFKAVLTELDEQVLRIDGGSTGTRFVNRFQIKTRLADTTELLLHSEGWSYTAEGAQELEWNVSAAEFNRLGTSVSTDYLRVWGEFRALYGGGVDELRGRTSPFVIGFGEEPEWPATRGDVAESLNAREGARVLRVGDTGDAGDSDKFSREDHVHPLALLPGGGLDFDAQSRLHVTGDAVAQFTPGQKIALLGLTVVPSGISFKDVDGLAASLKSIRIGITNPELLNDAVWVEGSTQGQPSLMRRAWATNIAALDLDLTAQQARQVANGLFSPGGDKQISVRLVFFDAASGGNEIERIGRNIPLVDRRDVAALQARSPTGLQALLFNTALAIDWSGAKMRSVTATDDMVISFDKITGGDVLLLEVTQDATGGRGITWPGVVEWAGKTAVAPSAAGGAKDLFTLVALTGNRVLAAAELDIGSP